MGQSSPDTAVDHLRRRAENALRGSRRSSSSSELLHVLRSIIEIAPPGSDSSKFAHRHLAELLLEHNPWASAVHLRTLIALDPSEEALALMGLCQTLLQNYRYAISCYQRALHHAPRNPWYQHNMGHLIDVALGMPERALEHLILAHRLAPAEPEITASVAHCLAAMGRTDEALLKVREAMMLAPRNENHRNLCEWIEKGAPPADSPDQEAAGVPLAQNRRARARRVAATKVVVQLLEEGMRQAGFSSAELDSARAIWTDFRSGRRLRVTKP